MITVKVSNQFPSWPLLRQTPGSSGVWGNCRFLVNDNTEECDFWVVYDGLLQSETVRCPTRNTIFVTGEPPGLKRYSTEFLGQFAGIITCHKNIEHPHVIRTQQSLPWHMGRRVKNEVNLSFSKDYDELKGLESYKKTKLISIISSNKNQSVGHRERLAFVRAIERYPDFEIDIFGRGIRDIEDKWDAIADYKYHIVVENGSYADYWTEKLADAYLGGAYPFYYGCPNLSDYFPENSYTPIDINDIDLSVKTIREAVKEDLYGKSAQALRIAKDLVLNKFNFLPQ